MKKTSLLAASALLSVMLISGMAMAKTTAPTTTAATAPAAQMQMQKGMAPMEMGGPMMLSEAGRKIFHDSMSKFHEDNKATIDQIEAKEKEVQGLLKAPTFDKESYLAKEGEIQAMHQKLATARLESFATAAAQMSTEDRAKLGEWHGHHKGMMGGKGMGGRGGMGEGKMKGPMPMAQPEAAK